MKVELEAHRGRALGSSAETTLEQYRIRVDGVTAGYVGFLDRSPICLVKRFTPIEVEEIEKQIAVLKSQPVVKAAQPPEVPPELMQSESEGIDADDLDS